ncbi:MAG: hypothetical protein ABI542_01260 [Gemmatimonadota bacterium]
MTSRTTPYRLQKFVVTEGPKGHRVSAALDGSEVWFESEGFGAPHEAGNAFLSVALLAAMAEGRDLDMSDLPPVSPKLLDAVPTVQAIWTQWNPRLSAIEVRANRSQHAEPGTGESLFFSGGIDATHSALEGTPGRQLVFVSGFDHAVDREIVPTTTARLARLAQQLGSSLTMVESNWVEWRRDRRLSGALMHGGCLTAVAHLLGHGHITISSSNSFKRLTPWGTHPLVDPLWSSERTTIHHWGNDCSRAEKIARVVREPALHADLWVCHERQIGNCGHCAKCARTRLAFHLLGSELPTEGGTTLSDPVTAYLPHLKSGSEHVYIEEMQVLARAAGHDQALHLLERGARRLARRHLLRDLRNAAFTGSAQRRMATTDLQPWGYGPAPRSL